jgi:tetratricopeptide (TPR) repeat protein
MKKTFVISIIALSLALCGANPATFYNLGNEKYKLKDYPAAIEQYTIAVDSGCADAKLFYNLGCAYFRSEDIGRSILWFERARLLSPRNEDIRKNLEFAKNHTQDKIESIYRNTMLHYFWKALESVTFSEYWWLLLILSLIATVSTIYSIMQLKLYWLPISLWSVTLLLAGGWYLKCDRIWELKKAVIIVPKVDVRSSPSDDGEILFTLHNGTTLAVIEKRFDRYRVSVEDGHTGWAESDAIEKVIP